MKSKAQLKEIAVEKLIRGKYQPRVEFNPQELQELADSILSAGLIHPVVVRPLHNEDKYEIVAGERRWRAAQLAQIAAIPCLVNTYSDEQAAIVTAIENINRVDLNPVEEARGYQKLIDEFGYLHEEMAAMLGKARTQITNSLRLLKLDSRVQTLLIEKKLSEGHGKILAGAPTMSQYALAMKIVAQGWSVHRLERELKKTKFAETFSSQKISPDLQRLEKNLSDYLGCPVHINWSGAHGQLHVDCHNLDILEGVLQKIGFNKNNPY